LPGPPTNTFAAFTEKPLSYRFDIASVAWNPEAGLQVRLIKDAFKA
jgi:hypothetical protein